MIALKDFIESHKSSRLIKFMVMINSKISIKPYRTCLVFVARPLEDEIPCQNPRIDNMRIVKIDKNNSNSSLSEKILEQMERKNDSNYTRKSIQQKLNNGGIIFAGIAEENKVAHHTWVEKKKITIPDIYLSCVLDDKIAYFASSYTSREYRKLGIGKYVRSHTLTYCRENNFDNAILNIRSDNLASIRLAEAMGFKEYQRVLFLRFLGFKLYKIKDSKNGKTVYKFGRGPGIWDCFYNRP